MTTNPRQIAAQYAIADAAWQSALEETFGRDACNARYQKRGKGTPGSELRALHDFYVECRDAWHADRAASHSAA